MNQKQPCPEPEMLLPCISGETVDKATQEHVQQCETCQKTVDQLGAAMLNLRSACDDDFLVELASLAPKTETYQTTDNSVDGNVEQVPSMIGRYRVVGALPKSGQAEVYRVVHPSLETELVAKVSKRSPGVTATFRDALIREGKMLKELDHPNIARIVDMDYDGEQVFLVMEFVRGRNLRQIYRHKKPTPRQAVQMIASIARGLAPAHDRGIVHADLKPANVIVDQDGRPRIIDFGMAMLMDAWRDDGTENGPIGGTPAYMSPEQAAGDGKKFGPWSDVFSLGAMLYEMAVGETPYHANSLGELLQKAARCEIDFRSLHDSRLPQPLRRICMKALSAEPHSRYASAAEMARDLEAFANRRKFISIGLGVAVMIIVISLIASFFLVEQKQSAGASNLSNPPPALLRVELHRSGVNTRAMPLRDAVPLVSEDHVIQLHTTVSADMGARVFWFNSEGELENENNEWEVGRDTIDKTKVRWPNDAIQLKGPPGTELVLICADAKMDDEKNSQIAEVIRESLGIQPLSMLPENIVVRFDTHKLITIDKQGEVPRGLGEQVQTSLNAVETRLDNLRKQLGKHCDWFAGEAFPHGRK